MCRYAAALDACSEASQRAIHDREHVLGVEVLAQAGRVDHIGKQHRDLLELLLGGLRMRTERRELLLERSERGVRDCVPQRRPLGLNCCDRGCELLFLGRAHWVGGDRGKGNLREV